MSEHTEQGDPGEMGWIEFVVGEREAELEPEENLEVPEGMRCKRCGGCMAGGLIPCEAPEEAGLWMPALWCWKCDGSPWAVLGR